MPRNDDGEYELVLGNRQLLSGFFFVVVLFGIFFTMGYFVGRHSSAGSVNAGQPSAAPKPMETAQVPPTVVKEETSMPAPGQAQVVPVPTETKPVSEPPPPPKPAESKSVDTASKKSATPPAKETSAPKPSAAPGKMVNPSAGDIYLQVSAPAPAAASSVVDALKRKGISSVLAPGPDSSTVRVLVGPLVPADIPNTRTQLENAGFKPFVRKY